MKQKNLLLMLESHIDKIVLTVFILISLVLLWVYVIGNPYGKKVRISGREQKLSPSELDRVVKQKLEDVIPRLDNPGQTPPTPPSYKPEYDRLVQCPISDIASSLNIPVPGEAEQVILADRSYTLPEIPPLTDISVEPLRGAARIPTEELAPEFSYESAPFEVEDIDLVSVSARFDVQGLVNNFQQSFMGPRLTRAEKDPRLAKPVFAQMDLQRRVEQPDGSWSDWQSVSRTRIDVYQKLIEDLPTQMGQLPYGVEVLMSQFASQKVQHDILQPESYTFTVSRLNWMAPEFLAQAQEILDKEEEKARREAIEERQRQRERNERGTRYREPRRTTRDTRDRRTTTRRTPDRRRENEMLMPGMPGYELERARSERTEARREKTVEDIQEDFEEELLEEKQDVMSVQDPLLVWAHDDTAEPGKTYQYRIRIGVFNPIAGKDWFQQDQADYKDQVVLWSDFSEPTDQIEIPQRIYMFPMDLIASANGSEKAAGVQVEVMKYFLGRWRDYDFDVYPGQIIGYEVEDDDDDDIDTAMMADYQPMMEGMIQEPETVDFTTGYMLVDILSETIWGSRLRPSSLDTILFNDTDDQLRKMAVGKRDWDSDVRSNYEMIQNAMEAGVQKRTPGMMPDGEMMDPMMMDPMMMEMMME